MARLEMLRNLGVITVQALALLADEAARSLPIEVDIPMKDVMVITTDRDGFTYDLSNFGHSD